MLPDGRGKVTKRGGTKPVAPLEARGADAVRAMRHKYYMYPPLFPKNLLHSGAGCVIYETESSNI